MKCTFCKGQIEPGTGSMFVYSDGKISYFCSSKCKKNGLKLKRDTKKVGWIKKKKKVSK